MSNGIIYPGVIDGRLEAVEILPNSGLLERIHQKVMVEMRERNMECDTLILSKYIAIQLQMEFYDGTKRFATEKYQKLEDLADAKLHTQVGPLNIIILDTPLDQRWYKVCRLIR